MAQDFFCDGVRCSIVHNEMQYSAVLRAVTDGRISEARLDESVLRLIKIKLEYKITE